MNELLTGLICTYQSGLIHAYQTGSSVKDIQAIECVKNLPDFHMYSYPVRLHRLNLQSLELRRLLTDLDLFRSGVIKSFFVWSI